MVMEPPGGRPAYTVGVGNSAEEDYIWALKTQYLPRDMGLSLRNEDRSRYPAPKP